MRKRQLTVPLLSEFFPRHGNLVLSCPTLEEPQGFLGSCVSYVLRTARGLKPSASGQNFLMGIQVEGQVCDESTYCIQLGLNVGGGGGGTQEIKLRLRNAHSRESFLPYTCILGTMLHELCHNHIGPHNQSFYKLLEELRQVATCSKCMHLSIVGSYIRNLKM